MGNSKKERRKRRRRRTMLIKRINEERTEEYIGNKEEKKEVNVNQMKEWMEEGNYWKKRVETISKKERKKKGREHGRREMLIKRVNADNNKKITIKLLKYIEKM